MESTHFDRLATLVGTGATRRAVFTFLSGLGLSGVDLVVSDTAEAGGKCKPACGECQTCKKGKCRKTPRGKKCKKGTCQPTATGTVCSVGICQGGACIAPTCTDSTKNGTETDVDCGGSCSRCANGQGCSVANDCISGTCTGSVCVTCTPAQPCGSDSRGSCRCDNPFPSGEPVCDTGPASGLTVDDCAKCPEGTETCVTINGLLFNCYKRCGSP